MFNKIKLSMLNIYQDKRLLTVFVLSLLVVISSLTLIYVKCFPDEYISAEGDNYILSLIEERQRLDSAEIVVNIQGAVGSPGLVRLPKGGYVYEAIELAGGALPGADLSKINLARVMTDGEEVFITEGEEEIETAAKQTTVSISGKININAASAEELCELPQIGPQIAQRIIDYRQSAGGFKTVDEFRQIKGIGDVTYDKIKDFIDVK